MTIKVLFANAAAVAAPAAKRAVAVVVVAAPAAKIPAVLAKDVMPVVCIGVDVCHADAAAMYV